ncbi:phosphatidate cytidylyltransferase [Corynebacterium sp.]|uniref:phosphatidate cytidylyltransferase n=1 Tax=Corynebacterium sp. TaxID=1720 RepID=UPI003B3B7AE0
MNAAKPEGRDGYRLPQPKNSAGRNLPVAIASGVGLGLLVVAGLAVPYFWYPLVAVAMGLATYEVWSRLRENGYVLNLPVLLVGGQAMIWASWPFGVTGLTSAFALAAVATVVARLFHNGTRMSPTNWLRDIGISLFVLVWIPMCGAFAGMLSQLSYQDVPWWSFVLTFMLCVIASDVGGYAAGVFFGSHPMVPAISPKKSWEGFAGSVVFAALVGMLSVLFLLDLRDPMHYVLGLSLGAGLALCATVGDLVESQFKRDLKIKDMSAMIPGHGGLMDRLDGMLPAAMLTWIVMTAVAAL